MTVLRNERGQAAALVIGVFLVLILFLGLVIDLGQLFRQRRAEQNACDAAALAGAQDLLDLQANPVNTAVQVAGANLRQSAIPWDFIGAVPEDANGIPTGIAPVRLEVTIRATAGLFLGVLGPSMPVPVRCAAQIVAATRAGLHPIGMRNQTFQDAWKVQKGKPCPLNSFTGPPPCSDFALTVAPQSDGSFGSGNTGLLGMLNQDLCPSKTQNPSGENWACVMVSGTSWSPGYCVVGTPGGCLTTVKSAPGLKVGDLRKAISAICATPQPPAAGSLWVLAFPLIDDAQWGTMNGSKNLNIVGFGGFELDCPRMLANPLTGQSATLWGEFVAVVAGPVGAPGAVDTGVKAVTLVE